MLPNNGISSGQTVFGSPVCVDQNEPAEVRGGSKVLAGLDQQ